MVITQFDHRFQGFNTSNLLHELAIKYGTDKCQSYLAMLYDPLFSRFRSFPINLLEIGVLQGQSLRLWYEYFPMAVIYGVDINPECKGCKNDRIKVFIGDQSDKDFLTDAFGNLMFNIIIDDGGHLPEQQVTSMEVLFDLVKPGGLYIIEDIGDLNVFLNTSTLLLPSSLNSRGIESIHFYQLTPKISPHQVCIIIKS